MSWKLRLFLVTLIIGLSCRGFGQASFSMRGSVLDPTGAGILGATVQLENASGALLGQSSTDPNGNFVLRGISGGDYSLVVPAYFGFASRTVALRLTGNVIGLKVTLATEAVSQEVTVGAEQSLSTDASDNRDTVAVTGDQLRKLPVFDQDYIAALTPFLDASAGSSGGVTLIVDGVEMKGPVCQPRPFRRFASTMTRIRRSSPARFADALK